MRMLKVTTKVVPGDETGAPQELVGYFVVGESENIEELVQMAYGSWYNILNYSYTPVNNIFISDSAIKERAIHLLNQKLKVNY